MSNETQDDIELISPGSILKTAREEQGLTREAVADKLHLRLQIIVDLEEDNYSADISATFTRGYIKLYSRLLGLDYNKVLEAYQQMNAQEKEPAKLQSFSQKVSKQASDQRLMMFTYFIIIIVLALVVMWWLQQGQFSTSLSSKSSPAQTSQKQTTSSQSAKTNTSSMSHVAERQKNREESELNTDAPDADRMETSETSISSDELDYSSDTGAPFESDNVSVADSKVEQVVEDADEALAGANVRATQDSSLAGDSLQEITRQEDSSQYADVTSEEITSSDMNDSSTDSMTAEEQPEAQGDSQVVMSDPVELVFTFAGDCWVKITDATGEDIAYGVKASGRVMPVSGIPPFEVVLGAPESVQITFAGEPVDMSRFRAGYTARFELPLGE
ncbi:DUF4115 domain-containing protein [Paraneptunicella aestuarii]|uniref:RodZ domain-containing protein n=1 Tax=Paraneptunicella aestuarii TaxID=2831148 RepID=UPI001E640FA9|nr:RodZ domain-containing protein [Paraneptunicella aestuarii]UAA39434.1 DUF4115 domain-containing protein [Paraneptunicella aestuarii]